MLGSGLPAIFSQHSVVLSPGNPLHHTQQQRQHLSLSSLILLYIPGQLNVRQCVSQIQDGLQYLSAAAAAAVREGCEGGKQCWQRVKQPNGCKFSFFLQCLNFHFVFLALLLPLLLLYILLYMCVCVFATRIFCIGNLASFSDSCRYVFFYFSCTLLHLPQGQCGAREVC